METNDNSLAQATEGLEAYLNRGIKEVIEEHPEITDILDEYEIDCGTCLVGTCLLKDIVEVHGLAPEVKQELMARINKAIHPESDIQISDHFRTADQQKVFTYSVPMKKLVDEHTLIKRLIALIPCLVETLDVNTDEGRKLVTDSIEFIRSYADSFHHAKEENILFKYFDEDSEIIQSMHEDHQNARNHVKAILEGVENRDNEGVVEHLQGYQDLLKDHIKKENEILYPWMDRSMTPDQLEEMNSSFIDVAQEFGNAPNRYRELVERLEERFKLY